jgi:hypothetical protein
MATNMVPTRGLRHDHTAASPPRSETSLVDCSQFLTGAKKYQHSTHELPLLSTSDSACYACRKIKNAFKLLGNTMVFDHRVKDRYYRYWLEIAEPASRSQRPIFPSVFFYQLSKLEKQLNTQTIYTKILSPCRTQVNNSIGTLLLCVHKRSILSENLNLGCSAVNQTFKKAPVFRPLSKN